VTAELHTHRDPHGNHLYATTHNGRLVLVVTTQAAPGVTRVEFTPAEWQALNAAIRERTTTHALTGKAATP
jgi:hypothetical protein